MDVLGIRKAKINSIAKDISKGNAKEFLDLKIFVNYETTLIYGCVVNKLKNFNDIKHYLESYLQSIDSWALTDALSFRIINSYKSEFLELANNYLKNKLPFIRRTGLIILLQLVKDINVLPIIFNHLNNLQNEQEYYVNMAGAWLLCEAYITHQNPTTKFFKTTTTNNWLLNKAIQKCRESFRVSEKDKYDLLKFKRK
jgi:3-methyladenine DNA glycosylase AlkD